MNIKYKYTKEMLEPLVKDSFTVSEVMRKLNMRWSGGSQKNITNRIKLFEIDMSHFTGQHSQKGKKKKRKSFSEFLVLRTNNRRQQAYLLRRALIECGVLYKCSECNLDPSWNGKELRLHVDHKDRNWMDDRIENLRFLCPNCHSQTKGYSGSKGFTGLDAITNYRKYIPRTPKTPSIPNWRTKDHISQRKVLRPSKETLEFDIKSNSFLALSKKYGVTDNAIRKWCKRYGLEWRKHIAP